MFNLYPNQVQAILIYIKALDAAEKEIHEKKLGEVPYPEVIHLKDSSDVGFGQLQDEVGGSWSWVAPK